MKKIKKITLAGLILSIVLPALSFAAIPTITSTCGLTVDNIGNIICRIGFYLNQIVPILVLLGVVYFIWGVVTYVIGNEEEAKTKGKNRIIYGIIGLVVIVSMWGLVSIVVKSFGLQQDLAFENPANIVDNNMQASGSSTCFSNYSGLSKPKLGDIITYITCLVSASVIPLIFVLAVAFFVWGVVQYVINSNAEAERAKGRDFMIWGIVALAVMVSVWGLVNIFTNTFNIEFTVPQVKEQ